MGLVNFTDDEPSFDMQPATIIASIINVIKNNFYYILTIYRLRYYFPNINWTIETCSVTHATLYPKTFAQFSIGTIGNTIIIIINNITTIPVALLIYDTSIILISLTNLSLSI